jgi:hypothetical protein
MNKRDKKIKINIIIKETEADLLVELKKKEDIDQDQKKRIIQIEKRIKNIENHLIVKKRKKNMEDLKEEAIQLQENEEVIKEDKHPDLKIEIEIDQILQNLKKNK